MTPYQDAFDDVRRSGGRHGHCRFLAGETDYTGTKITLAHDAVPGFALVIELDPAAAVVGYTVRRLDAGRALTAKLTRTVPWFEVERDARAFHRRAMLFARTHATRRSQLYDAADNLISDEPHYPADVVERTALTLATSATASRPKQGRPETFTDEYLARLAARYVELSATTSHPRAALVREKYPDPDDHPITANQVRNALEKARPKILTRPPKDATHRNSGVAGGELTDYGRRLLASRTSA